MESSNIGSSCRTTHLWGIVSCSILLLYYCIELPLHGNVGKVFSRSCRALRVVSQGLAMTETISWLRIILMKKANCAFQEADRTVSDFTHHIQSYECEKLCQRHQLCCEVGFGKRWIFVLQWILSHHIRIRQPMCRANIREYAVGSILEYASGGAHLVAFLGKRISTARPHNASRFANKYEAICEAYVVRYHSEVVCLKDQTHTHIHTHTYTQSLNKSETKIVYE